MDTQRFNRYYKSTEHFEICNPNPRWKEKRGMVWDTGDCVIRALANSIGCEWIDAYDFLSTKARRDFAVPNDPGFFRKWFVEGGAIWNPIKAEKGKSRITVLEFAKTHPNGRYVITIANHDTACVDGKILDAWNCGEKCVVGYYDMSNFRLSNQ